MKKLFLIMGVAALIFTGCNSHYYKINKNSLTMYLKEPNASSVLLLSSLDDYSFRSATKKDDNMWEVTLPNTLEFTYFYIVDGKVFVPSCRFKENDDFGSENCLFIPEP